MKILGIDPGLHICGYAVIDADSNNMKLLEAGICRTNTKLPIEKRLVQIARDINSLLEKFNPEFMSVEELYSHYAHPKTAILMGHARGVILEAACGNGTKVRSFAATRIKKSLTGNGRASKLQMQRSITTLLGLAEVPEPADVADAIAAALCCANSI
ncbi:MAG: Crossover junction endodeoxyribonuclease RuvC [Planctomycetes bacterium ADurb.Bin401]|nr:MAG: Crossover junction endodeoxyribonuclease RuvC [Planctomycetes bacterium ADurb.Bin401]